MAYFIRPKKIERDSSLLQGPRLGPFKEPPEIRINCIYCDGKNAMTFGMYGWRVERDAPLAEDQEGTHPDWMDVGSFDFVYIIHQE